MIKVNTPINNNILLLQKYVLENVPRNAIYRSMELCINSKNVELKTLQLLLPLSYNFFTPKNLINTMHSPQFLPYASIVHFSLAENYFFLMSCMNGNKCPVDNWNDASVSPPIRSYIPRLHLCGYNRYPQLISFIPTLHPILNLLFKFQPYII